MLDFLKSFFIVAIFPLYLIFEATNPAQYYSALKAHKLGIKLILKNISILLLALFVVLPMWAAIYFGIGLVVAQRLRLLNEPIPISGTGSMYPTFPKGKAVDPKQQAQELVAIPGMLPYPNGLVLLPQLAPYFIDTPLDEIFGKNFFGHTIERGDIVVFENQKTDDLTKKVTGRSTGLVKRAIGLPDDTIEIKDGLVYINNKPLTEPYIARARSTFGGDTLPDCAKLVVPAGKLFVMGDNRKGSSDSRFELGLIDYMDVDHVLPLDKQTGELRENWRDTSNDLSESSKIHLDKNQYLRLLNDERVKNGLDPLKYNQQLENGAMARGRTILKFNDFSIEATRSGYSYKQAMADSGYSNIVTGETITPGYFEADELIEGSFEFGDKKQFLLEKDFDDIGIAEVEGQINGCNTQVIVQNFGGYLPPNYSQQDINDWKDALNKLREVQPSWSRLKEFEDFYNANKSNIDRINEVISIRISHFEAVIRRMEANEWLTDEESGYAKQDQDLGQEQNDLADKINNAIR